MNPTPFDEYFAGTRDRSSPPDWLTFISRYDLQRWPERFFSSGVVLGFGDSFSLSVVAALAERSIYHTFLLLGFRYQRGSLRSLRDRVFAFEEVDPELVSSPHFGRLRETYFQGDFFLLRFQHDRARAALLAGALGESPDRFLASEPDFRVSALVLDDCPPGPLANKETLEAVLRWKHPPRRVFLPITAEVPERIDAPPGSSKSRDYCYVRETFLADPDVKLYKLNKPKRSAKPRGGQTAVAEETPPPSSDKKPLEQDRGVKVESWEALVLGPGMRLVFQPSQTVLQSDSLRHFLQAVQRSYAETLLGPPPSGQGLVHATAEVKQDGGESFSERIVNRVTKRGILGKLAELKKVLEARPDLEGVNFGDPKATLPQEPCLTAELPGIPNVLLSIKARISGRGVSLLIIPSDRRTKTKDAFEWLLRSGIPEPYVVQVGGMYGRYAHCLAPGPSGQLAPRAVYFDYEDVNGIAAAIVATIRRLRARKQDERASPAE